MPANELPPLDECLSAMDERIEFLSSALSSLSEELTSRKPSSSSSAANPLAVELARVKAKLKEAEAKLASNAPGGGDAALREQVALLERENAGLRSATGSSPTTSPTASAASEVKALKSKLVQANNEIDRLRKDLAEKTEELESVEDALESSKQQAYAFFFSSLFLSFPLRLPSPHRWLAETPGCLQARSGWRWRWDDGSATTVRGPGHGIRGSQGDHAHGDEEVAYARKEAHRSAPDVACFVVQGRRSGQARPH
jgi:hypothetical protein